MSPRCGTASWSRALTRRRYNPGVTNASPLQTPNARECYQVTAADLPLACPMPSMSLWNSHPRVYLPIERTGFAKCPYCSAEYVLAR